MNNFLAEDICIICIIFISVQNIEEFYEAVIFQSEFDRKKMLI